MAGIGVFGGTFDPFHAGHLVAATEARATLGLARVLLVVAADPWQKAGSVVASAADRLAMVVAGIAGVDGLEADRSEIDRGGPTYTVDTLADLHARCPDDELVLIVGSDVAAELLTWHRAEEVRALARLAVLVRRGAEAGVPPAGWVHDVVETTSPDLSSRAVRALLASGAPVDGLVPPGVVEYVRSHGLYGSGHRPVPTRRP